MNKKSRLMNKWSVFKENHPTSHIAVMIIMVNVVFILGSALIISLLPENDGVTFVERIRRAFTLMVNPSGRYTYSDAPISRILTTVVVLLGMISLTGGTVGFVTSVINGFMEKTANDKRTLKLKDHIVILNYNQRVPSILCDYCFDDMSSTYIVILTDQDKDEVNARIDEMYNQNGMKKRFKNVIVRSGNPMSRLDLDRLALSDAQTVLIMTPEGGAEESRFAVSKLFMFVSCYLKDTGKETGTNVVVETSDEDMDTMIRENRSAGQGGKAIGVQQHQIIGKILGITAMMPTVNDVLRQLFSFEGVEIYTREIPGKTIDQELRENRSVLPLFDQDGKRVYIAENEEEFGRTVPAGWQMKKPLPKKPVQPFLSFVKNEIIIVGINTKLPYILESLTCFRREYDNKVLHAVLCDTAEKADELRGYYSDPRWAEILMPEKYQPVIIRNIYRPMDDLKTVVDSSTDTVLFLSDEASEDARVDEKPLLYWSDVSGRLPNGAEPDVVVELRNPENQTIIRKRNQDQILVSDDFLGHLYAQLGKNPLRLGVIMDMITSEGDTASVNEENEAQNAGDLMSVPFGSLMGEKQAVTFASKRELILWVHEATGGKVLPIGCTRNGVPCLFARTDNDRDGLDSAVLLGISEKERFEADSLVLQPEDELIAFINS